MLIYFLGYLIRTSAVTWHKVTWPKASECKYTNIGATLKVLKNAIFFQIYTSCLIRPSLPIFSHIPPIYVFLFFNILVCPFYALVYLFPALLALLLSVYLLLYPFLYFYLDLICIEEELKGIRGFRFRCWISRIWGAINPFYLGNLSLFIGLA